MKILLFVVIFLLLGAFFIIGENNLSLKNSDARMELGRLYFSWIRHVFDNSRVLVGYVVKLNWLPENE
jgi:hypothetical protein